MIHHGCDLRAFARRCLDIFDDVLGPSDDAFHTVSGNVHDYKAHRTSDRFLTFTGSRKHPTRASGRAGWRRALVRVGAYCSLAEALETTMHEMLHVVLETRYRASRLTVAQRLRAPKSRAPGHNVEFQHALIASAGRAWDVSATRAEAKASRKVLDRVQWVDADGNPTHVTERRQLTAYALDDLIVSRLEQKFEIGSICRDTGLWFGYPVTRY